MQLVHVHRVMDRVSSQGTTETRVPLLHGLPRAQLQVAIVDPLGRGREVGNMKGQCPPPPPNIVCLISPSYDLLWTWGQNSVGVGLP